MRRGACGIAGRCAGEGGRATQGLEPAISPPPPLPSLSRHPDTAHAPGRRRKGKLKALVRRMKERRAARLGRLDSGPSRKHKRKAALALSASVMGLGTAAMPLPRPPQRVVSANAFEKRTPATLLSPSDDLLHAMIEEEGARQTVYRDVAGYPTVGVGHLVRPADHLQVGDRISKDQVLEFLEQDLAQAQQAVRRMVGDLPLYQNEYDALVDLAFNVGEGNLSPERSPELNAAIAAGDYDAIAQQLDYRHAAGHIAAGLVYRSERRENIFTDASYADPRDAGQAPASINI